MNIIHIPTFVRCVDQKYYQDLVYQDFPQRREWFVVFDAVEPAEIVVRESALKLGLTPYDILLHRGFSDCLALKKSRRGIFNGRATPHKRFFGPEEGVKEIDGHSAISWFLRFQRGVPLPTPCKFDSCVEVFPFFPNKDGVYFGDSHAKGEN